MSPDNEALRKVLKELESIGVALSVIALNQRGAEAANATERKRYDDATQKCVNRLLKRIEALWSRPS
jgi:hypothetical protein